MPLLVLVRHGQAAAGWGRDADPGLSDLGRSQAVGAVAAIERWSPSAAVVSSPLRRAQETAVPLAERWAVPVAVDAAFGEIPSPSTDLAERARWLGPALEGTWSSLDPSVHRWRDDLLDAVRSIEVDTVAFTHFVAINAVVGAIAGSDRVTTFLPGNASVTVVSVEDGRDLRIVERGSEAPPVVG